MKTLFILLSFCVFVIACSDMQKPMMKVISEPVVSEPVETTEPVPTEPVVETQPQIPAITFENALNLTPGKYRVRPTSFATSGGPIIDRTLNTLYWGNIKTVGNLGDIFQRDDFPADAPNIALEINVNPQPYAYSKDEVPVIHHDPVTWEVLDEIVIEIASKSLEVQDKAGPRGKTYTFTYVSYTAKVIENLTSPDRVFEYE